MERRELNVRELLELERQIYQESIDRVLQQQEELNNGVLEDFVKRCKPFEDDRERELEVAKNQWQFSQLDASSLLEFDLQQADDVFKTQGEQLKRKLLEGVKRKRVRIEKRLQMLDEKPKNSFKMQRKKKIYIAKEKRLLPKVLEKQLLRAQLKTRKNYNFRHLSEVLPTPERIVEDVMHECDTLQRNRESQESIKMAEEEDVDQNVKVMRSENGQKLICRGESGGGGVVEETFCVGDAVVLTSRLTEEDFHGFVSAITSEEVKLVLVCGTHARVAIARLRNRQCTLQKQRPVVFTAKRENGKEEHHVNILPSGVATSLEELLRDPPDVQRRAAAVLNRLKRKTTIDIRRGF